MNISALPIGTKVYVARVAQKAVALPCPDCRGELKWIISLPSLASHTIDCPRCLGSSRFRPLCWEYALEITEGVISRVDVVLHRDDKAHEVTHTDIRYTVSPYNGSVRADNMFTSREAAELFGKQALAERQKNEDERTRKDRERDTDRAGMGVMGMLQHIAEEKRRDLESKIDVLKEKMLEAISYPNLHGPKLKRAYPGAPNELTSESLGEWLDALFREADLDGWTEEELREATCHC